MSQPPVTEGKDWYAWHAPYADPEAPLSRRLRLVQQHIDTWLDERRDAALTVVSVCAGQGRDLLGILARRTDAARVTSHLIETDPRNLAVARASIEHAGVPNVHLHQADAGDLASYAGLVPADLVLLVGVLGNLSDADAEVTIRALPALCAAGATVIWTRSRYRTDVTGTVRRWLGETGFVERAFHAPAEVQFTVGVHRFAATPRPLPATGRLFRFLR